MLDRCGSSTCRVELVNDIDHVTGFTDEDLTRFSMAVCTSEHWSPLAYFNLSALPLRSALEFRGWISPSLRQLSVFLCLPALQLHSSRSFRSSSHLPSCPPTMTPSLSISIPLFHCLFTSLHQSVQHHSFLSLVLATGNNSLSSLSLSLFSLSLSFRVHRILSALSGTTATRKLF